MEEVGDFHEGYSLKVTLSIPHLRVGTFLTTTFSTNAIRCTEATFVLVARDPLNRGSAFINPLEVVGEEEEKLFKLGEESKVRWALVSRKIPL